MSVKTKQGQT